MAGRHPRISGVVAVIVVLAAGVAAGWLVGGGGGSGSARASEAVAFTPAAAVEGDAFTPPADIQGLVTIEAEGPFGGSGSNFVCDRERLIAFLDDRQDRQRAWARVEAIEPTSEAVAKYIRSLRPATLLEPTRVTNHTFKDGKTVASQAILDAGTAVLVDDQGAIRVRCRTGAPLLDPILANAQECDDCPADYKLPNSVRVASTYYAVHPAPPRTRDNTPQPAPPTKTVTVKVVKQLPPEYVVERSDSPTTVTIERSRPPEIRTRTVTVEGPVRTRTVTRTRTRTVTVPVERTITVPQTRTVTVYEGSG
jgi:hypothetical protein